MNAPTAATPATAVMDLCADFVRLRGCSSGSRLFSCPVVFVLVESVCVYIAYYIFICSKRFDFRGSALPVL
jgi:hypothetical protein